MTTLAVSFLIDPFKWGINTGITEGAKLFPSATKDRAKDDLLTISQSKVADIMATFRHDSNMFFWSKLVNMIGNNKGGACSNPRVLHSLLFEYGEGRGGEDLVEN